MEIIGGKIKDYDERTRELIIIAPYDNVGRLTLRKYDTVEIGLPDSRRISPEQRRKAHALIGEIADWCGELPESMKRLMKMDFIVHRLEGMEQQLFSLSDCDVTTAREFISFLIDFMLENAVPAKVPLVSLCDDIERYIYSCLMHKRCANCGKKADLHHFDAIGMGRDREEIYQIGMPVIPLCRKCHEEAHQKGKGWITEDLHLIAIPLTAEIGKVYKLTKKNLANLKEKKHGEKRD